MDAIFFKPMTPPKGLKGNRGCVYFHFPGTALSSIIFMNGISQRRQQEKGENPPI